MNKELKYGGHTASPADYECPDGDLAATMDLWPENGALKPVLQPGTVLTLDANKKVVYVHETAAFKHYIVYDNSTRKLHWIDDNNRGTLHNFGNYYYYYLTSINSIGNTLIVFNNHEGEYEYDVHYENNFFLWKPGDGNTQGGYAFLGEHLPDVELSFGLVGHPRLYSVSDDSHSTFNISFDSIGEGNLHETLSESNQNRITEQIMAKVNKFVADQTVNKGRFCFPFFVRYALRLYDGSLTKHSAPILMCPSTKNGVTVLWNRITGRGSYTNADCDIMLVASSLDYRVVIDDELSDWKDIVKSVDVFVSKPIYTYDQNGKITNFYDEDDLINNKFIGKLFHKNYTSSGNPVIASSKTEDCVLGPIISSRTIDNYTHTSDLKNVLKNYFEWGWDKIYALYFNTAGSYPSTTIHLPEFSDNKVNETLASCSSFFKLTSISTDELLTNTSTRKEIIVDDEYLQSLLNREQMTDDYLSHDKIYASNAIVYNQRINYCGIKRELFQGFSPDSMFCYVSGIINWFGFDDGKIIYPGIVWPGRTVLYVKIVENGKEYWRSRSVDLYSGMRGWHSEQMSSGYEKVSFGAYLFYPNVNAQQIVIIDDIDNYVYVVDLKPHDFLNGAYALLDFNLERRNHGTLGIIPFNENFIVDNSNKLYTSEVNNPFFYPVTNINTIGTGRILGISTAAKALSQGQFGQFPLYAFTTDGVWALEVSATTGGFSARQPITRDVCINPDSITQIDDAVLFATDRGIMLISGSQTKCITEAIDGRNDEAFSLTQLPQAVTILAEAEEITDESEFNFVPFRTFLGGCGLIYDYPYQRLIIFNPAYKYAYVYSMTMKQWAMMRSGITSAVNSYPEALAMTDENKLVDFSQHIANETPTNQILVTRPLKLDAPDLLKTIDHIIQRGRFARGNVKILLYGSRDLGNWFPVFSSTDHYLRGFRGTPYKYFRIVLKCTLDDAEELAGCSIEYKTKETNQLR